MALEIPMETFKLPLASYLAGFVAFIVNMIVVIAMRRHDELRQVRLMLTSLRVAITLIMTAQLPIIYLTIQYGSPVEQALLAYRSEGRSWLYYLGRPATTFLGVIFGFFSDLHFTFRYVCFLTLMMAVVMDTLSEAQVSDRLDCLLDQRCPVRGSWNALLLNIFLYRDLVGMALSTWALLIEGYLMSFIGFYRQYYSYRQLTVGEFNRILTLQESYAVHFGDLFDVYFGSEDKLTDLPKALVQSARNLAATTGPPDGTGGGGVGSAAASASSSKKRRSASVV